MNLIDDIPLELAIRAHAGTSHTPEQRGKQERASYASQLQRDLAGLERLATTDEKRATLAAEFERYRIGYRARYLAMLMAKSRCMSTMVTGGSNFPTKRNQRRGNTADKRTSELLDFRIRALGAIRKALTPELAPVMAGDSDAIARLTAKIEEAERVQGRMKRANAAIRKHHGNVGLQIAELIKLGYSQAAAAALIKPDDLGRRGYADFQLKNNNAEIRRLRERLESISKAQAQPDTVTDGEHARLEESPAANRVRLFFPGRPAAEVISRLKSGGFRWTPSLGCWQAYHNERARAIAHREAGIP